MHAITLGADDAADALNKIVTSAQESGQFSGSVLIAEGDEIILETAVGMADIASGRPNAVDTPFRIASVTKGITAVLVLQAVERKELALDQSIARLLPELSNSAFAGVTINHLLTHTSGIPDFGPEPVAGQSVRDAIVAKLGELSPDDAPGTNREYCNVGYTLLGVLLEQAAGQEYAQLARERVFKPVGMTASFVEIVPHRRNARARGYERENGDFVPREIDVDPRRYAGAGGVVSTAPDLLKFSRALSGDALLSPTSRAAMFNGEAPMGCKIMRIPLGPKLQMFEGGMTGSSALVVRVDEGARTLVLLSNHGGDPLQRLALWMLVSMPP